MPYNVCWLKNSILLLCQFSSNWYIIIIQLQSFGRFELCLQIEEVILLYGYAKGQIFQNNFKSRVGEFILTDNRLIKLQ